MVREPKLKPLLVDNQRPLDELGRSLIAAANEAGGRDNITVILFSLEEVEAPAAAERDKTAVAATINDDETNEYDTFTGEAVQAPRQGVSRPQAHTRTSDEGGVPASDAAEAEYRASGTVALSAVRPRAEPIEEGQAHAPPRSAPRRRRRRIITAGRLLALGCVVGLVAAFWLATRQIYFVGVDESRGNVVTLYEGLPYDLPLGIRLYSAVQSSGVTFESVPARRRATFTDHKLRSRDDAESLIVALERGQLN
jgi:protein phosphatase